MKKISLLNDIFNLIVKKLIIILSTVINIKSKTI